MEPRIPVLTMPVWWVVQDADLMYNQIQQAPLVKLFYSALIVRNA